METKSVLRGESGMVLVIALVMIVVLTLVVITATSTAIFETKLSGNKRGSTTAFFAAEGGVQATMANINNFSSGANYIDNKYDPFSNPENQNPTMSDVTIEHDPDHHGVPRGTGMSAINFEFDHYFIQSTGTDQIESGSSKSNCTIEEKVVRLLPTQQGGY